VDFQDPPKSEKVARNPNNFNILKGGKVDPRSELYQRSVAGREQLKDYLSRLSNSGADEADVFMAGVKSLMNRGHGYVGAYLDSKNPGRRYEKNQAMAITDKVMTDEGIGEHPGARLTKPKVTDEEGNVDKEATKEARDKRKEANAGRGSGPQQAPGPSAKPVGQQRKEGKRESTGQALEDSRRKGIGDVAKGPVSEWQNTLKSRLKGEASTQDVLSAFQKQYQSQIGGKKKAAPGEGAPGPSEAPGQPPTGGGAAPEQQKEEEFKPTLDAVGIRQSFKDFYSGALKRTGANIKDHVKRVSSTGSFSTDLEDIIDEIKEKGFDVNPDEFKKAVGSSFGVNLDNYPGWDSKIKSQQSPDSPGSGQQEAAAPTAAPEAKTPQPGQQEAAAPQAGSNAPKPEPASALETAAAPQGGGEEVQEPTAAASKKPGGGLNIPKQPTRKGGGGFTPEIGKQATDTIRQAVSEGKSPQEVVEQFKQGNLFPGGLVTDTAQTNPLEGGSTPASPGPGGASQTQEERGGSLLDEQGQAKDFRKSGPQPTGGGTARQLPLPLGRENTAAKLKGRADAEKRRLAKEEKSLGKPSPRPRKTGKSPVQPELFTKSGNPRKFNTSEMSSMSYDEFSQSVRSLLR
jgi:hypothetical protein